MSGFLFAWCLLGFTVLATAQQLNATIETYFDQYDQERIYLHFDKSSYFPGETVWFKVYMMDATLPADASKSVYLYCQSNRGIRICSHLPVRLHPSYIL